ncbi:MAG: type II toxin-antitoxin system HicB family antitoxin [Cyclobacteriaceae bacterium]
MKNLTYKGYTGSIEYSKEDGQLYGKVLGIRGLISFEGDTGKKLEADFMDAIDAYLTDCKQNSVAPEKPFKGSFNVRISPKLHRKAALLAMEENSSLNSFVAESIRERIIKESGDKKRVKKRKSSNFQG